MRIENRLIKFMYRCKLRYKMYVRKEQLTRNEFDFMNKSPNVYISFKKQNDN